MEARQFISFFSGIMGMDSGFERSGMKCLAVNDIDRRACATLKANLEKRPKKHRPKLYEGDIRSLDSATLCSDLGVRPGDLFALIGGPPCQAFSTAGRRLGLNDERGNVFLHFIDLIATLQPKYAIFENVRGLLSAPLVHRPHNQRGSGFAPLTWQEQPKGALRQILSRLRETGYETTFTLYNTANFGVPQTRERLIFFASREGKPVPFIAPTHSETGCGSLKRWVTLRDAIGHLGSRVCEGGVFPERRLKYYKMLREGQNWRDLPDSLQQKAMGKSFFSGGGKTGFYRRLAWDKPCPTLVTSPTMPATDLCHPDLLRPLSVEEYAAIQTFPEEFTLVGSTADKYRQLGNAVPCLFAEAIANHVIAFDQGKLSTWNEDGKLSRYENTDHDSWSSEMPELRLFA